MRGSTQSFDPLPSQLKSYAETERGKPYITAEFKATEFDKYKYFIIGDGTHTKQRTKREVIFDNTPGYFNKELIQGTTYSFMERAYVDKVCNDH